MIVLFMGHIPLHVDVPYENQAAKREQFFFTPTELGILHVALHDTDKSPGIAKVCIGDFVKNNSIARANLTDLTRVEIDKELCWCCLASRKDVSVVRNIAIQVGFAGFSGCKFNHVVVVFDQWNAATEVK